MKLVWIIFIIFCLIIFTYIFVSIRNPITNLNIYYYDATITNDNEIVSVIQKSWMFFNLYTIYIIKCNEKPGNANSRTVRTHITKLNNAYYVTLACARYNLKALDESPDEVNMRYSDGVIPIPYVSFIWSYHTFSIILQRREKIESKKAPYEIYVNEKYNGPLFIKENITVMDYQNVIVFDRVMKGYMLNFH